MSTIYCLGVMTGTSCDGADLALLKVSRTDREVSEKVLQTASRRFPKRLQKRLRLAQAGQIDIPTTAALTRDYSLWVAEFCDSALKKWGITRHRILIAIHGQTVWHAPKQGITVQLLEPAIVTATTGCTVTAAFRTPDLARGGEGAPLVPLYHWLRATSSVLAGKLPFAIHNVGGIANLTYVTRDRSQIIAFDTGPGNALMDIATQRATAGRKTYDRGGRIAATALNRVDWTLIRKIAGQGYFRKPPPKSTGRELFNEAFLDRLPGAGAELVANATALTAHSMARAYADFILKDKKRLNAVFFAGGGARNPTLIHLFQDELFRMTGKKIHVAVLPHEFAPAQFLEAMAFARLGFEAIQGHVVSIAAVTGAAEDAYGAGIFPGRNYRQLLKLLDMA